jgi:hypothetical protein
MATVTDALLEQFVEQGKGTTGHAAADLIAQATSAPGLFAFGELLDLDNVKKVRSNEETLQTHNVNLVKRRQGESGGGACADALKSVCLCGLAAAASVRGGAGTSPLSIRLHSSHTRKTKNPRKSTSFTTTATKDRAPHQSHTLSLPPLSLSLFSLSD